MSDDRGTMRQTKLPSRFDGRVQLSSIGSYLNDGYDAAEVDRLAPVVLDALVHEVNNRLAQWGASWSPLWCELLWPTEQVDGRDVEIGDPSECDVHAILDEAWAAVEARLPEIIESTDEGN